MSGSKASRTALNDWVRALQYKQTLDAGPHTTLLSLITDSAAAWADRIALIGEADQLTYGELIERARRYGDWALRRGLVAGEVVGLLMPNCPEYVAIWLGLTQVGCVVALINTNLTDDALLHAIRAAGAGQVIIGGGLVGAIKAVADRLPAGLGVLVAGDVRSDDFPVLELGFSTQSEPEQRRVPGLHDRALLIYTSGTTGLPKAANVTHGRVLEWSRWFAGMMDVQADDRLYNCLPLYHSTGGVVAVGAMLTQGASMVIRPRFSASRFWDDVVAHRCTIFQYIGELCRYLLNSAPHPRETSHQLRLCCGNGLSGAVWERFEQRFQIPRILEFYAATEGNVSLYNCEGKPGAIGRIPPFLKHRFPIELVRVDAETGAIVRDADGRCVRCAADEAGEAIGQIVSDSASAARRFDGYTDDAASARKVLTDVFAASDRWFRTGDLMRRDAAGFYYFVDRSGDTFRWKGENVSTTEVAATIAKCRGVGDAVVYGVAIPGIEGRAGMVAIRPDVGFRLADLRTHLIATLPDYARPLFVRICETIEMTGTFKLAKGALSRDGLNCRGDAVWFDDRPREGFIRCDAALLERIPQIIAQEPRRQAG